jgi:hypothetical protein
MNFIPGLIWIGVKTLLISHQLSTDFPEPHATSQEKDVTVLRV